MSWTLACYTYLFVVEEATVVESPCFSLVAQETEFLRTAFRYRLASREMDNDPYAPK